MSNIIGIGTSITECLRIARMIERHGELFIDRVYTREEIRYCRNRKQATQHFAGRWAAKEAVLRALGTGWRRGISCATSRFATSPTAARSWPSAAACATWSSGSMSPGSW